MSSEALRTVEFFRQHILRRPGIEDLPTIEDVDAAKLPALRKLFLQMHALNSELTQAGIPLSKDQDGRNIYNLTDVEYENWPRFVISLRSNWLDPKYPYALHAGFNFHMHLMQDGYEGRGEIADWITVDASHLDTTPISLCSYREHVRTLPMFAKDLSALYFSDIPMEHTDHVSFDPYGLNFKTESFNQAVNDACTVMGKLILRKPFLKVIDGK
jgi:hypothetical protein